MAAQNFNKDEGHPEVHGQNRAKQEADGDREAYGNGKNPNTADDLSNMGDPVVDWEDDVERVELDTDEDE
jgi:hypothetical protein